MSATVLYMSMSVDGFIAGPNEGPNNGLGDGGERLHDWLWSGNEPGSSSGVPGRPSGVNGQIYDEFMSTGAVVARARHLQRSCKEEPRLASLASGRIVR
jgi:hypothetical protein